MRTWAELLREKNADSDSIGSFCLVVRLKNIAAISC
jgi:hypothetical protein